MKKRVPRGPKRDAVTREDERAIRELIRRWQALPPGRRTHVLRKRLGLRGSAM